MVRAWSKSASVARQGSTVRRARIGGSSATRIVAKSVQLAGMSERLPSGSTTSSKQTPRRCMAPITCRDAALKGMPLTQDCYRTWKVAEMGSV